MKRIISITLIAIVILTTVMMMNYSMAQIPAVDATWTQTWGDEFVGNTLSPNRWCRTDHRKYSHGHETLGAYRSDNNDNLDFTGNTVKQIVREEDHTVTNENVVTLVVEPYTYHYSAPSWMLSQAKFKYGYYEIRCKLPALPLGKTNAGIGANFWLNWHDERPILEAYSEIDIFEFIAQQNRNHIHTHNTHHQGTFDPEVIHENPPGNEMHGPDFSQYHNYAVHWTPSFVKYYFDGNEIYNSTFFPSEMIPMRVLIDLNVIIGPTGINASTLLPYEYEIDYVRIYQLKTGQCNTDYVSCNLNQLQPSVYRSVSLGGLCNHIQSAIPKYVWASNNITIYGDYTVPLGAELTLDISPCYTQEIHPCNPDTCVKCQ